jgi:hypothetical protein
MLCNAAFLGSVRHLGETAAASGGAGRQARLAVMAQARRGLSELLNINSPA